MSEIDRAYLFLLYVIGFCGIAAGVLLIALAIYIVRAK